MLIRVFGTPCGGTQYATRFLQGLELEVGHERLKRDGIVCGFMALGLRPTPRRRAPGSMQPLAEDLDAKHDVHLARHPLRVAETLWRYVNKCPKEQERMRELGMTRTDKHPLTALQWWVLTHEAILQRSPALTVRVGVHGDLIQLAYLVHRHAKLETGLAAVAERIGSKKGRKPALTWDEWRAADPDFAVRGARLVDYLGLRPVAVDPHPRAVFAPTSQSTTIRPA